MESVSLGSRKREVMMVMYLVHEDMGLQRGNEESVGRVRDLIRSMGVRDLSVSWKGVGESLGIQGILDWVYERIVTGKPASGILDVLQTIQGYAPTHVDLFPNLRDVTRIYNVLYTEGPEAVVRKLVEWKVDLDSLPYAVTLPLRQAIFLCKMNPGQLMRDADACRILGRDDLASLLRKDPPRLASRKEIAALRYCTDQRLVEVENLLMFESEPSLHVDWTATMSMEDISAAQQTVLQHWTSKSFSVAVGRAMFTYDSKVIVPTEIFVIPKLVKSARMPPLQSLVELHLPEQSELMDWPEFHMGVATALQIRRDCGDVTSSWIVFNQTRGDESIIDASHGGFIFGLGLQSHLRKLDSVDSLRNYFLPQFEVVTVGHLLGLAVAYLGTRNRQVSNMTSVHIPAMLPPNAVHWNTGPILKSGAVVGYALVHLQQPTQFKYDKLWTEMRVQSWDVDAVIQNGTDLYLISVGFSIGLVGLGGMCTGAPMTSKMVDRLVGCVTSDRTTMRMGSYIALGLLGLRSNAENIIQVLEIPRNGYGFEFLTPEEVMIRIICLSLVQLDRVEPTVEWIDGCIPDIVKKRKSSQEHHLFCFLSLVSGCCFVLGVKFAGTSSVRVKHTLVQMASLLHRHVKSRMDSCSGFHTFCTKTDQDVR
jgi:hypothetical protein